MPQNTLKLAGCKHTYVHAHKQDFAKMFYLIYPTELVVVSPHTLFHYGVLIPYKGDKKPHINYSKIDFFPYFLKAVKQLGVC